MPSGSGDAHKIRWAAWSASSLYFGITLRNSILMITHYERSCRSRGHAVTYECLSGRSFAPVRSAAAAGVNQTCIRNSSGSLVVPAAIRRAASRVNSLARDRRCSYCRRAFSRRSPMCSGPFVCHATAAINLARDRRPTSEQEVIAQHLAYYGLAQ